jgi:hypothetical protein
MFGREFFTQPDEGDWVRMYDRDYARWAATEATAGRDFMRTPVTLAEKERIFLSVMGRNNYQRWREQNNAVLAEQSSFWKGTEELQLASLEEKLIDRPRLQPFKIKYDTLEEVRMRFNKTVLLIKGHPFSVSDQRSVKGRLYLLLENPDGEKKYIAVEDVPDFRPAPSVYVQCQTDAGFLVRSPARVNQQGMTHQSVHIKRVGGRDRIPVRTEQIRDCLMSYGKVLKWDDKYAQLIDAKIISSMRLSDRVAVYQKGKDVVAEYKGRRLGKMDGHGVRLYDEDDSIQPWLKRDLSKVELEVMS